MKAKNKASYVKLLKLIKNTVNLKQKYFILGSKIAMKNRIKGVLSNVKNTGLYISFWTGSMEKCLETSA